MSVSRKGAKAQRSRVKMSPVARIRILAALRAKKRKSSATRDRILPSQVANRPLSPTAIVLAGAILHFRGMLHDQVECLECGGTGAKVPDCHICKGYRSLSLKSLHARGWKNDDLEGLQGDGMAECPAWDCQGAACSFCEGEGKVPRHEAAQQARRVLIYAKYGKLPPVCSVDWRGCRRRDHHQYLSAKAADQFVRDHKMLRSSSILSDDLIWRGTDDQWLAEWRKASRHAATERLLINAGDKKFFYGEPRRLRAFAASRETNAEASQ